MQPAQLDIQGYRGQGPGQCLGEAVGGEDREPWIDAVVELALHAVGSGAAQLVGQRGARDNLHRKSHLDPVTGRTGGTDPAADESACGVGDRIKRRPAELEHPILLCSNDIHGRNEV